MFESTSLFQKSHDTIIVRREPLVARLVGSGVGMLPSVNFDNQPVLARNEVANIRANRLLPDKLAASDLPIAKAPPQFLLGICLVHTQSTRSSGLCCPSLAHVASPLTRSLRSRPLPASGER